MEVYLDPDKEARLTQIAALHGVQTDELAQEVLNQYLEEAKYRRVFGDDRSRNDRLCRPRP